MLNVSQRTPEGLEWDKYKAAFREVLRDPAARRQANINYLRGVHNPRHAPQDLSRVDPEIRAILPGSVHVDTLLSNLSIRYVNDDYVGTRLMPFVPVDHVSDDFLVWDRRDRMASPDDTLGYRATPNEVEFGFSTENYSLKDYGLMGYLEDKTLRNQDAVFDLMADKVEGLSDLVALRREMRIATVVQTVGNYAGNTDALTGSEWDSVGGGDPITNIRTAVQSRWKGGGRTRTVAVTSRAVWNVLSRHEDIRGLYGTNFNGIATPQTLAPFFGIDEILIAEAQRDIANEAKTADYQPIWGDIFAVLSVQAAPSRNTAAFGVTFRERTDPFTYQWYDPKPGKSGGHYAKVAVSEDHRILAPETGYLLTDLLT